MAKTKVRCDICNQDFKWQFLLDNHLTTKTHLIKENAAKVAKENDAKENDDKKNDFEEDLENDMETEDTHTEKPDFKKNYPCEICKEDFSTQPDLRQHLTTKTHLVKGDAGKYTCVSPKKALEAIENKTSPTKISVNLMDENNLDYFSPKRAMETIEEDVEKETSPTKISVKLQDENLGYFSPKRALEPIEGDVENETSPAKISRIKCKFGAKKCSGGCN